MRRSFNSSERTALLNVTKGRCSICGKLLTKGWHADHIIPFSAGGKTDVINGQAVCKECNLKKGANYMFSALRDWQREALKKWTAHEKDTFLCVACPGAGKTSFALSCAYRFLQNKNNFLIVLCHTRHLKKQWAISSETFGIKLDHDFDRSDGSPTKDFNGICITYQALGAGGEALKTFRRLSSLRRTLIVFDEIHHLGEGLKWGNSAIEAFGESGQKLALSGTPIRSGQEKIPFITYRDFVTSDGRPGKEAIPDYSYSYRHALEDDVCRNVYFPRFNGQMDWIGKDANKYSYSFTDEIPPSLESQRLRTALDPAGEWLQGTLREANERIDSIRQSGHPAAAGIVFAQDVCNDHAFRIYQMLQEITGDPASIELVTSEDQQSSDSINNFRINSKKWIVSVRMISEGVDIPRLRVGVHATNYVTELFFRQAVGRICRYQEEVEDNINQASFYYIPADERLVGFAQKIRDDVNHTIEDDEDAGPDEGGRGRGPALGLSFFEPISSTGYEEGVTADSGDTYSKEELLHARSLLLGAGLPHTQDMKLVEILRQHDKQKKLQPSLTFPTTAPPQMTTKDRLKKLRKNIHKKVGRINKRWNLDYQDVHNELNQKLGCRTGKMTEEQLNKKLEMASLWAAKGEI